MKKISRRNRHTKERRHRRMEEARRQVIELTEKVKETTDEEELKKLKRRLSYTMANSTRSAHQL